MMPDKVESGRKAYLVKGEHIVGLKELFDTFIVS
jgi:hypothetical protein